MVRLITQNLLSCPSTVCAYPANFPLSFRDVETVQVVEVDFNEEFLRGFLARVEWDALRKSAAEVRCRDGGVLIFFSPGAGAGVGGAGGAGVWEGGRVWEE